MKIKTSKLPKKKQKQLMDQNDKNVTKRKEIENVLTERGEREISHFDSFVICGHTSIHTYILNHNENDIQVYLYLDSDD